MFWFIENQAPIAFCILNAYKFSVKIRNKTDVFLNEFQSQIAILWKGRPATHNN